MKLGSVMLPGGCAGELYVMLNESRARGSSAAFACRKSSAAIASSIWACCSAETCCSAAFVTAARESGAAGGLCAMAEPPKRLTPASHTNAFLLIRCGHNAPREYSHGRLMRD